MQFALRAGEAPDTSEPFRTALAAAVAARVAFTDFVDQTILSQESGTKGLTEVGVIKGVAALAKVISDALLTAWRESRGAADKRAKDLIARLDSFRWRSFGELVGG